MKIDILHIRTQDGLRLQSVYYKPEINASTCVLFIHGMSGNFIENYFGHIAGKYLSKKGLSFIYSHNRGYNHINDIPTKQIKKDGGYKTVRNGAVFERFKECLLDIDGWIKKCQKLNHRNIILAGHSLGCNKVIYYLSKKRPKNIKGLILASPPDMVGLVKKEKYQPNYQQLLKEARQNLKNNKPKKILSSKIWDWHYLSSQTFLDFFVEKCAADNLPVLRKPDKFKQLAKIDVPILGIMGEYDDIAIRTLKKDLDLIASKAINCPSFTKKFIKGGNHNYERQEKQFAKVIYDWASKIK